MKKNKTGQYLKYAIGEIILVAIGILIALQINDWNQARINNNLQVYYIKSLIDDIESDIEDLNSTTKALALQQNFSNKYLTAYKDKIILSDSLQLKYMTGMTYMRSSGYRNITLNELKYSGRLPLITSDSVRQQILEYNYQMEKMVQTQKYNNQILSNIINPMFSATSLDANSIWSHLNLPNNNKPIEVDPYRSIMSTNLDSKSTIDIIDALSARHLIVGLNEMVCQGGLKSAIQLKSDLETYLESLIK